MISQNNLTNSSVEDTLIVAAQPNCSPTLIIPYGVNFGKEEIFEGLSIRINTLIKDGFVRIAKSVDPAVSDPYSDIQSNLDVLLGRALWQRFFAQGYITQLPDNENFLKIQILVIYKSLENSKGEENQANLEALYAAIKSKVGDRANFLISLICLGKPFQTSNSLNYYCPKIFLCSNGLGGVKFSTTDIAQACQNLIVDFSVTDLWKVINNIFERQALLTKWITLGASSIYVNTNMAQTKLRKEILKSFIKPLITPPPDQFQSQSLDSLLIETIDNIKASIFIDVVKNGDDEYGVNTVLSHFGWRLTTVGTEAKECVIDPSSELAKIFLNNGKPLFFDDEAGFLNHNKSIFPRVTNFIKSQFSHLIRLFKPISLSCNEEIESMIQENYRRIYSVLKVEVAKRTKTNSQQLLDIFTFIFDRDGSSSVIKQLPFDASRIDAHGFKALKYSIIKAIDLLKKTPNMQHNGNFVKPVSLQSEEYWKTAAEADSAFIKNSIRRFERFNQIISPWFFGVAIIIIGWPFLYTLLDLFLAWEKTTLIAVSLTTTLIIIFSGYLIWRTRAQKLLQIFKKEISNCLSKRIYGIVSRIINDYQLLAIAQLQKVLFVFHDVEKALVESAKKLDEDLVMEENSASIDNNGMIYSLDISKRVFGTESIIVQNEYSLEWPSLKDETVEVWRKDDNGSTILSWKSEARKNANVEAQRENDFYHSIETSIISKCLLPLFTQPSSSIEIIKLFRDKAIFYSEGVSKPQLLDVGLLSDEESLLFDGKKWEWLFQHAHPLGAGDKKAKNLEYRSVMLVPNYDVLNGPTGKSSKYWKSDWQVVNSTMLKELGCIRFVIINEVES